MRFGNCLITCTGALTCDIKDYSWCQACILTASFLWVGFSSWKKIRARICVTLSKFLAYFEATVCHSPLQHTALIPALAGVHAAVLTVRRAHTNYGYLENRVSSEKSLCDKLTLSAMCASSARLVHQQKPVLRLGFSQHQRALYT